jgi:hypothetical protein
VIRANRTRRAVLQGLAVVLGDQAGGPAWLGRWVPRFLQASPAAAEPAALSTTDLDELLAFTGVIATGRDLTDEERRHVTAHVRDRETAGQQFEIDAYRTTARVLRRLANGSFAALDGAQRTTLVRRHHLAGPDPREAETGDALAGEIRLVRTRVVTDLVAGYYASPSGWAAVGYHVFPGRCGDLDRYTRAER